MVNLYRSKKIDFEQQRGIGWDHATGTAGAVAQIGGDDEPASATSRHALHALVPATNDLTCAQRELERLAPVFAGIEFHASLAVFVEPAGVVHAHILAGLGGGTGTEDRVFVLQAGGGGG
jgi:hypothetical protein